MKNSYVLWVTIGIIIAGLVVGGWFLKSGPKEIEGQQGVNASTTAVLTTIRNDVFAKKSGTYDDVLISASTTIAANDSIKTGIGGRALVENDDFKTVIDHDSEVSLTALAVNQAKLNLNSGSVWLRVQKVFGAGEGVEVETANAVAVVRGTSFGLSYLNGITTLFVTEGTVAFRSKDSSEEVLVHAGEKATLGPDGKIKVSPLTETDKNAEWFKYNNSLQVVNEENKTPQSSPNPTNTPVIPVVVATSSTSSTPNNPGGQTPVPTPPPADIRITRIDPTKALDNESITITIYGVDLNAASKLYVGDTKFSFVTINDSKIIFNLEKMKAGTYSITVSGQGTSSTLRDALVVLSSSQYPNGKP